MRPININININKEEGPLAIAGVGRRTQGGTQGHEAQMDIKVTIPHTSTSDDGSYTQFHVLVRIGGSKSYTLTKRYSDFATLKKELESLYSDQMPYKFPRKTFIRSSVKNGALAEERRVVLERFLQECINDKINTKWRKSLPFREFLNLAPGTFSNANEQTKELVKDAWAMAHRHDGPIVDVTTWLDTAREAKTMLQDARCKVFVDPGECRKKLILSRTTFDALSRGLEMAQMGDGERKRRVDLLNSLKREHGDVESLLRNVHDSDDVGVKRPPPMGSKTELFKGRRVIGEPQETDRTRALDNHQLLQLQKQDFIRQDEELHQLHSAIQKQRELGIAINDELQLQNELLDELDGEVDRVGNKLHYARKRVGRFT